MTQEQSDQFDKFGCASRCLFLLANMRGTRNQTKGQFIDEFAPHFAAWNTKCGGTNTGMLLDLAQRLGLATALQVYRDPQLVRGHLMRNETNTVLLITEKRPPSGGG